MQLVLMLPAALFVAAVVVRDVPPLHDGAERLVMLYASKTWTLWLLLLCLPLAVLVTGCATLLRGWRHVWSRSLMPVAATTLTATIILAVVVLHMLAN
jgi:hypothetical protein